MGYFEQPPGARTKFVTRAELAEILCVSERTIDRWRQEKILPEPKQIGKMIRWPASVIDKLGEEGRSQRE